MRYKLGAVAVLALFAGALLQAAPASADGLGIYPTEVEVPDTVRGGEYFRDVGVINDEPSDLTLEVQPGGEVGDWISFHTLEDRTTLLKEIVAPAETRTWLALRVLVPEDAPNGEHRGTVILLSRSTSEEEPESGEGLSKVNIGVSIDLAVTVSGTQRLEGKVLDMSARDTEVGYPLRIRTSFENTGNVRAQPKIDLQVKSGDDSIVGEASYAETVVFPGENESIASQWDTTGQDPGDYVAGATVSLGDAPIDTRDLGFELFPVGTLTRRGVLEGLELANEPEPGGLAKIIGSFRNTGLIETQGKFVGELYHGDQLIEELSSEERLTLVGELGELEVFASVPEEGKYTVRGKVNYEGKETETMEFTFRVGSDGIPIWVWIGVGGGIIIVGAGLAVGGRTALRRRGR